MFAYLDLLAPLGFFLFLVSLLLVHEVCETSTGGNRENGERKPALFSLFPPVRILMMWAVVSCWLFVAFLHDSD